LGHGRDVVEGGSYNFLALKRAWRIEHPKLWKKYVLEREDLQQAIANSHKKLPDPKLREISKKAFQELPGPLIDEINESWLLHGTKPESVLGLLQNGLNERFSGGMFVKEHTLQKMLGKTTSIAQKMLG